jgi:hypothetical protein
MAVVADLDRMRRLFAGTTLAEDEVEPDPDEVRAAARRAWLAQWKRARPLVPPLGRLDPERLAVLRARAPF